DAAAERGRRIPGADLVAEHFQLARRARIVAADDLADRRFASAVLADDAVDLALREIEVDVADHLDAEEGFPDVDQAHAGLAGWRQRICLALGPVVHRAVHASAVPLP